MDRKLTKMERALLDQTDVNPKDLMGVKKPPLRFIPPVSLIEMGSAMRLGGHKYGPYNWRENDVIASIYYEAMLRHAMSFFDGEDVDPESGAHHLGHVMACCGILLDAARNDNLIDDRPEVGPMAAAIREFTPGELPDLG